MGLAVSKKMWWLREIYEHIEPYRRVLTFMELGELLYMATIIKPQDSTGKI